jgi:hypothetical protein
MTTATTVVAVRIQGLKVSRILSKSDNFYTAMMGLCDFVNLYIAELTASVI